LAIHALAARFYECTGQWQALKSLGKKSGFAAHCHCWSKQFSEIVSAVALTAELKN
jgi:hypothetical protein